MVDALVMTRGDDRTFEITALDKDGDPANLTDVDLWFTAKRSPLDLDLNAVIQKTVGAGITIVGDPTDGIAAISVLAADTLALDDQGAVLFWDLQSRTVTLLVTTLARGTLVVTGDITRST